MFIAENGTFVMYKGEEVLINALDKQVAKELIEVGRQIDNAYIIVCGKRQPILRIQMKDLWNKFKNIMKVVKS